MVRAIQEAAGTTRADGEVDAPPSEVQAPAACDVDSGDRTAVTVLGSVLDGVLLSLIAGVIVACCMAKDLFSRHQRWHVTEPQVEMYCTLSGLPLNPGLRY